MGEEVFNRLVENLGTAGFLILALRTVWNAREKDKEMHAAAMKDKDSQVDKLHSDNQKIGKDAIVMAHELAAHNKKAKELLEGITQHLDKRDPEVQEILRKLDQLLDIHAT